MPIVSILMYYCSHNIYVPFVKDVLVGLCIILFPSVLLIAHERIVFSVSACRVTYSKTVRMKYFADDTVRFSRMC